MKMLPKIVPGVLAGALVSAMVFAAPVTDAAVSKVPSPMDREAAYHLAMAN
ncbi:MAG: hypothetical protein JNN02_04295 [Tabrizicola sp.]|nr:hypothetical protein [Tabrizicola sp.]